MKVKICGLTNPEDALYAAETGADFIGILFAPSSKRFVPVSLAQEIANAVKQGGAEPVAVFVDETAEEISNICLKTGIKIVQLHGSVSKQAFPLLKPYYQIIYATSIPSRDILPSESTFLFDHLSGGSGKTFDWEKFSPPKNRQWILAGGLNPGNVAAAIKQLHPYGVDVASGVECSSGRRKDPLLVKAFIQNAKRLGESQ